jgi:hypothetical protein
VDERTTHNHGGGRSRREVPVPENWIGIGHATPPIRYGLSESPRLLLLVILLW